MTGMTYSLRKYVMEMVSLGGLAVMDGLVTGRVGCMEVMG